MTLFEKYVKLQEKKLDNDPKIIALKEVLEQFYPNRWEITLNNNYQYGFHYYSLYDGWMRHHPRYRTDHTLNDLKNYIQIYTTIHFPEIEIVNRNKSKHLIKDLYVQIRFNLFAENQSIELYGTRATLSTIELLSGYGHSHLNGMTGDFKRFCKGDSDFGYIVKTDFITEDKDSIKRVLLLMEAYLGYESIEGVPHRYMENSVTQGDLKDKDIYPWQLNSIVKSTKFPLKINKDLKITNFEEIERILIKNNYIARDSFSCYKSNGKYYSQDCSEDNERIKDYKDLFVLNFKNQEIRLKIENYATGEVKKYPHPKLTRKVIEYWEREILKNYIRNYRTGEENSTNNSKKSMESSKISMLSNMGS